MIIRDYAYKFWRYLAVALAVAIFFGASLFIVTTLPPRQLVMATGPEGDASYELGIRYREILAKEGVKLQLQRTSGSMETLKYLRDPRSQVSVGFVQGGTTTGKEARSWSRWALCFTNRCGFSAEVKSEKAHRRCGADGFR
jgi:hypothetical protein